MIQPIKALTFRVEAFSGDRFKLFRNFNPKCAGALLAFFLVCALFPAPQARAAEKASLRLENQGVTDLLNMLLDEKGREFFLRLDLAPKGSAEIENPAVPVNMRVDCGLFFVHFENVPLENATALVFGNGGPQNLVLDQKNGQSLKLAGRLEPLVPQPGSKPVCELSSFTPGMKMEDVCAIVPEKAPRDDNDAVLAGLGFAGLLWAARLYPGKDGMLEHLELRRPLDAADLRRLTDFLWRGNYVPWQAELPGMDVDFAEMSQKEPAFQREFVESALANFLKDGHGEATIMFAPAGSLPLLADADSPPDDVQLFTLNLRPKSNLLLLDVAAYKGREPETPPAP